MSTDCWPYDLKRESVHLVTFVTKLLVALRALYELTVPARYNYGIVIGNVKGANLLFSPLKVYLHLSFCQAVKTVWFKNA